MSADTTISKIFTEADDAIQALWGFHNYLRASHTIARDPEVEALLPSGQFQMTHEWPRLYNRSQLISVMQSSFDPVQTRFSLVPLASLFEAMVEEAIEHLHSLNKVSPKPSNGYKAQLAWYFCEIKNTTAGSRTMLARLPVTSGDVDNVRRLRNDCVHNKFRFSNKYFNDAIRNGWVAVQAEAGAVCGQSIRLSNDRFEQFCRSHLELLHIGLNTIQRRYFDPSFDFNYAAWGKANDWSKILNP